MIPQPWLKLVSDASIIPFPVSAHLVRFLHVIRLKYCLNNHLSDVYGLRSCRTSKSFCCIWWIGLFIFFKKGSRFHKRRLPLRLVLTKIIVKRSLIFKMVYYSKSMIVYHQRLKIVAFCRLRLHLHPVVVWIVVHRFVINNVAEISSWSIGNIVWGHACMAESVDIFLHGKIYM